MENPHEQQQSFLLARIVANINKLNQSMTELNNKLENVNKYNGDIALIGHMWSAYDDSVRIHIENTKNYPNQYKIRQTMKE
ncbi:DASH complex subunit Dad4 [Cokeromyces recurvatus]|uniref:DASH complex subunit Dad4 n=1 Tax=Cokeromyces recurvatus TaxID=90255 RepID=UPI00221F8590|nr:DASH complex subunit Dad4 [Cokeromyces recurvatus]KAI7898439.1 DASH complex subunit Dad4 [Cokeromyces recurvatus]